MTVTGGVTSSFFDPFGNKTSSVGSTNISVGFQGDYTDPASGDVWMGARWYTPGTDTFSSRDTYDGQIKTPVSLNRYTYGNNNPVGFSDPDGHASMSVLMDGKTSSQWASEAANNKVLSSPGMRYERDHANDSYWAGMSHYVSSPHPQQSKADRQAGLEREAAAAAADAAKAKEALIIAYVKTHYAMFDAGLHPENGADGYACEGDFKKVAQGSDPDAAMAAQYVLDHHLVHQLGGDEPSWLERTVKKYGGMVLGVLAEVGCFAAVGVSAAATAGATMAVAGACSAVSGLVSRGMDTMLNGGSLTDALKAAANPTAVLTDFVVGAAAVGGAAVVTKGVRKIATKVMSRGATALETEAVTEVETLVGSEAGGGAATNTAATPAIESGNYVVSNSARSTSASPATSQPDSSSTSRVASSPKRRSTRRNVSRLPERNSIARSLNSC